MFPEDLQKLTPEFRASAENLFALLETLLAWSHLQQGAMPYIPVQLSIYSLIERNIDLVSAPRRPETDLAYPSVPASGSGGLAEFRPD